jgi:hypothetical protein
MKDQQLKHILDHLAKDFVPEETDLWPSIRVRLETGKKTLKKGEPVMNATHAQNRRLTLAFASAVVVILLVVFFAATPMGRALAQEIMHFFTRAGSDAIPAATPQPLTWVTVTPGEPVPAPTPMAAFSAECGDFNSPRCTVDRIRSIASFPVLELGTIPTGMQFVGATGGPDGIAILYDNGNLTQGLMIWEQPLTENPPLPEVGASAVVEAVQIGTAMGEYVKGSFMLSMSESDPFATPEPGSIQQVWDANAGFQTLVWTNDGVLLAMQYYGPEAALDKAGLVALAAGLTSETVAGDPNPLPVTPAAAIDLTQFDGNAYDLTVAQAAAQAGFDALEPKQLPQIFFLQGATYQPDGSIVRIFYLEPTPPMEHLFGLRLSEQPIPSDGNCALCNIVTGDYGQSLDPNNGLVVGSNAVLEQVQIAGFDARYVEGMWGKMGAWSWLPYPEIMTLRWQANGMAFELYYAGFTLNGAIPINKADLFAIAESIMK